MTPAPPLFLAAPTVTWIKVEKPVFDLVGEVFGEDDSRFFVSAGDEIGFVST